MRCFMVRSLLQGIQRYKNIPQHRSIPGFNNSKEIRSIRMAHTTTQAQLLSNDEEHSALMAVWPQLVKDLTENKLYSDIPEATKWLEKVLDYNVPSGKKHRGLILIHAYRKLAHPVTEENLKLARVLAWCFEIGQSSFQIQDDLIDRAETRKGQLCWHLRDNIGVAAINDSFMLELSLYQLLRKYFQKHECYTNVFETLTESALGASFGQALDILSSNHGNKPDINLFSMDRFNMITKYRGAQFFHLLPVRVAMYLAGITDPGVYQQTDPILLELGHLYLVQNDYADCYCSQNITGHSGTDIQVGKCSWLVVTALDHATPAQRKILQECYGEDDPEKVARVKQVYDDLDLPALFAKYEEKAYNSIKTRINQMTCDFPKDLFDDLMVIGQD